MDTEFTVGSVRVFRETDHDPISLSVGERQMSQMVGEYLLGGEFSDTKPILDALMEGIYRDCFEAAAIRSQRGEYLTAAQIADKAFEAATPVFGQLMAAGKYGLALQIWMELIQLATDWSAGTGHHIHRGTAFFFASVAAWKSGNLDLAFRLLHSALKDDAELNRRIGRTAMEFPAYYTASLVDNPSNFLYPDVRAFRGLLEERLRDFTARTRVSLSLSDLENALLQNPLLEEERFLFTYTLAWLQQWESLSKMLPEEDLFSRVRRLQVYLSMAIVLDKILSLKTKKRTLGGSILEIAETELSTTKDAFKRAALQDNDGEAWKRDFGGALKKVLSSNLGAIESSLAIMWGLRNHAAHSLDAPELLSRHRDRITALAFDAIFFAASILP